jgi:WD40 repeat protein
MLLSLIGHTSFVYSIAFSPDGKTLASGSGDGTAKLWDAATGMLVHTLLGHTGYVRSVAFSPDGATLATGANDGTIRLWDTATGMFFQSIVSMANYVCSVAFSPAGSALAAGLGSGKIGLWEVTTGGVFDTLTGHSGEVLSIAFPSDGKILASGSSDGTVRFWETAQYTVFCHGFAISKVDWEKGCVTIRNRTTAPLDLVGWSISDGDKSFTFPASIWVAPGESYAACPGVYNSSKSSRGLVIDSSDEAVTLYSPEVCGGTKESTKRQ